MKFQNPSFKFFLNGRTNKRTNRQTDERTSRKQYAPHFFKVGAIKSGNTIFQIITLSVAMETSGQIWPNFELIQAFMHDLFACKYEKDQMKNRGENVMTSFSPL